MITQIVTIIALVLGPTLAVAVTLFAQNRAQIRNQRLYVFQTLMAFRLDPFNAERIKALGLIDIVFHNVPEIRAKWKEYYESLNDPKYKDLANDAANVWRGKQNAMLAEMAQSLGYGKEIKYEEIDRAYAPILFLNNALVAQNTAKELLRVLEHSENFGTPREGNEPKE